MSNQKRVGENGFTLVELTVTMVIISIVAVSFFGLFVSLVNSTIIAKRRAVAITLATNQMENLKSLPYDSLTVQSPTTSTQTVNGVKYTTKTVIEYVDDAYDGCASYATLALKQLYCRNYPPPALAPDPDLNPADYKIINVAVTDKGGTKLASVDTQISARVSETASTTGALFVTVTDPSGSPISGATVSITNSVIGMTPKQDDTDTNGIVIFYGLAPDSNTDYVITATKTGYSSLQTSSASGSLQPTYPSQKILTQQSSYSTLKLGQQGTNSLLIETTDTLGAPITGVKVYAKGGYKKYTALTDYSYYFDNYYSNYNNGTLSDSRPITGSADGSNFTIITDLPPINGYIFCNSDNTASIMTNCAAGVNKYYLAAALPYGGNNSLLPITIPQYDPANPPSTTYSYGTNSYLQEVRLMLTTSATFPRVYGINPGDIGASGNGLASFQILINGYNLSGASAKITQGSNTYTGTGCTSSATQLTCNFNLSTITPGVAQLSVTNGTGTLTLPTTPQGGFDVIP